jgi:hypothetical protein
MKRKPAPPRPSPADLDETEWLCGQCEWSGDSAAGARAHLSEAHAIPKESVDALRGQMSQHLDADRWYETVYHFKEAGAVILAKRERRGRRRRTAWFEADE